MRSAATRRLRTVPALFVAAVLLTVLAPLWVMLTALADLVRGRPRLPTTRLLAFGWCWAWLETAGVLAATWFWLTRRTQRLQQHYRLQRWWAARLMGALGGLNAAQSCEVGDGTAVITRTGSQNNDPIRSTGYRQNSHGGLIGGITSGMPLVCRVGFKPTSTINKTQQSVRKNLEDIDFTLEKGRHDPCVGVRAGITLESRMAIELLNAVLAHQTRHIDPQQFKLFSSQ